MAELAEELLELIDEDARYFACISEVETLREVMRTGTSSTRQRRTFEAATDAGAAPEAALRAVVEHLVEEFHADL